MEPAPVNSPAVNGCACQGNPPTPAALRDPPGNLSGVQNGGTNGLCPPYGFDPRHNQTGNAGYTHDASGVNCRADYYPFGQPVAPGCAGYESFQFAGLFTDAGYEDGGYSAAHRRYSDTYNRWFSPDPAGRKAVDLTNPQTWNMYAYVTNNPTSLYDPSGLVPPACIYDIAIPCRVQQITPGQNAGQQVARL